MLNSSLFFCCVLGAWLLLLVNSAWAKSVEIKGESLLIAEILDEEIFLEYPPADSGLSDTMKLSNKQIKKLRAYVETLERTLDANDKSSEVSKLNKAGQGKLSDSLYEIIILCESWRLKTKDKLSCRNGHLVDYWRSYADKAELPSRRDARQFARLANRSSVNIETDEDTGEHRIRFPADVQWQFREIASAYVLDQVNDWLTANTELRTYRVHNKYTSIFRTEESLESPWSILLDPAFDSMGDSYRVGSGTIAYSQFVPWNIELIGGRNISGVVDDSTGWPAAKQAVFSLSSNAFSAHAISHLGAVETAQPILTLLEGVSSDDAFLVAKDGRFQSSAGIERVDEIASSDINYRIEFEIPQIDAQPYHRPYLSIWISDMEQKPLRNLLLLGDEQRWMQELRVWWRRVGRRNQTVIDGLSSATKRPGQYKVVWDGLDDYGAPVAGKELLIHIEASRENGGRSYKKIPIDMNQKDQLFTISGEDELGDIVITVEKSVAAIP